MLTCVPHSVFSWNYSVSGLASGVAQVGFPLLFGEGRIAVDGVEFAVRTQGWGRAHWSLERGGTIVAVAVKRGVLRPSFDVDCDGRAYVLKPQGLVGRGYDLHAGDALVGTIEPEHPLTRKARVDCGGEVSETVQLFAFWLVAAIWRSNSDSTPV